MISLKQYDQQHKSKNTYNEQLYNNYSRSTTQRKSHERTHNNKLEVITVIRLQETTLVTGLITEKEMNQMTITSGHDMED